MAQHDPLQRSHAYEDIFLPLEHWCLGIASHAHKVSAGEASPVLRDVLVARCGAEVGSIHISPAQHKEYVRLKKGHMMGFFYSTITNF